MQILGRMAGREYSPFSDVKYSSILSHYQVFLSPLNSELSSAAQVLFLRRNQGPGCGRAQLSYMT